MAHLLMIESWLGGNAVLLPPLLRQLGHTYTFITRSKDIYPNTSDGIHPVVRYADTLLEMNTNDVSVILDSLPNVKYDGVITTCDYYIGIVSEVADKLGIPCPFPKKVENVRYKHKLRKALDAAGIPNTKYALANNWDDIVTAAESIGYPLVLKPVDLSSSAFVRLITNQNELRDAFETLDAFPKNWRDQERDCTFLLEEYMVGDEVSVEALTFQGVTTVIGITQKSVTGTPYFIEDGHMFPADFSDSVKSEISTYVVNALQAAEYDHGVSHTEVKLTNEGLRIVEINPRTAGDHITELVEFVYGISILNAFVDFSLGLKPNTTKQQTDITSACVKFLTLPRGGKIVKMEGAETLQNNINVISYEVDECVGKIVEAPIDNTGRYGRIMTKDAQGYNALKYAQEAASQIKLTFE